MDLRDILIPQAQMDANREFRKSLGLRSQAWEKPFHHRDRSAECVSPENFAAMLRVELCGEYDGLGRS